MWLCPTRSTFLVIIGFQNIGGEGKVEQTEKVAYVWYKIV